MSACRRRIPRLFDELLGSEVRICVRAWKRREGVVVGCSLTAFEECNTTQCELLLQAVSGTIVLS
jgi:hypothetical protein